MVATYFGRTSAGATGSDPYAYTQMAVDFAQHGSFLHPFPLVAMAYELGLAVWPTVHVGYHLPPAETLVAPTVWSPGAAFFLAIGYWLGGEAGLRLVTPTFGLGAVCLAGLLIHQLAAYHLSFREIHSFTPNKRDRNKSGHWLSTQQPPPLPGEGWSGVCRAPFLGGNGLPDGYPLHARRWLVVLTCLVLATSYRQVELTLVTMSDVPAQFWALLTLLASWQAARRSSPWWGALAGVALGMAFWVRYTQLLLVLPLLTLACCFGPSPRLRNTLRWLTPATVAALLAAAPSLWYHAVVFGSPWRLASYNELSLFALDNLIPVGRGILLELLRTNEFGYLIPFLWLGCWFTWRHERRLWLFGLVWVASLTLLQLPYAPLRLRGVLSILPVLAAWSALGVVVWWQHWRRLEIKSRLVQAGLLALPILLLLLRMRLTLLLPLGREISTFGYLDMAMRQKLTSLTTIVPPDGVVGASLNSGAVELYAQRLTVRPAYWSEEEWAHFAQALAQAERPLYLLIDGSEMTDPLIWAQAYGQPEIVWRATLPYFSPDGVGAAHNVELWLIRPAGK
jgi:hypothetical protein